MFDLHKKSHPNDEIVGWLVNLANKIFPGYYMLQREFCIQIYMYFEFTSLQDLPLHVSSASLALSD